MTTRLDGLAVGDFAFTDSEGFARYAGRTCNLYGSAEDAKEAGSYIARRGGRCYVFRTVDGLYGFSAIPDPRTPEMRGAELVLTV